MPTFKQTIETLRAADARGELTLSFSEYVTIANLFADPEKVFINNHADLVNFAKVDPEVEAAHRDGKKIDAIKALGESVKADDVVVHESLLGPTSGTLLLLPAKNAVEAAFTWPKPVTP